MRNLSSIAVSTPGSLQVSLLFVLSQILDLRWTILYGISRCYVFGPCNGIGSGWLKYNWKNVASPPSRDLAEISENRLKSFAAIPGDAAQVRQECVHKYLENLDTGSCKAHGGYLHRRAGDFRIQTIRSVSRWAFAFANNVLRPYGQRYYMSAAQVHINECQSATTASSARGTWAWYFSNGFINMLSKCPSSETIRRLDDYVKSESTIMFFTFTPTDLDGQSIDHPQDRRINTRQPGLKKLKA
ncbi:hypothetical protein QBC44DRAFT_302883 [Cladorrhinum sp. PSN332]|nr:hypothetical protein QBC44DRAFT_302883 [Cladorrhinum sp. PSN332]